MFPFMLAMSKAMVTAQIGKLNVSGVYSRHGSSKAIRRSISRKYISRGFGIVLIVAYECNVDRSTVAIAFSEATTAMPRSTGAGLKP